MGTFDHLRDSCYGEGSLANISFILILSILIFSDDGVSINSSAISGDQDAYVINLSSGSEPEDEDIGPDEVQLLKVNKISIEKKTSN